MNRRKFLQQTGAAASLALGQRQTTGAANTVFIVADPADRIASSPAAKWASKELETALTSKGLTVQRGEQIGGAPADAVCVLVAGSTSAVAREILAAAQVAVSSVPEAIGLVSGRISGKSALLVCGSDVRGVTYGLLDLADRVALETRPLAAFDARAPVMERPANRIRSITRCFVSDVEDKGWYNDRAMWPQYLGMLASQRFNRFSLATGIGYDFLRNIRDCYLHFAYPFLVSVPGYNVRAVGLPDAERDRNFELLKFIGKETAMRGLDFQLAIWTHGYRWSDSPNANYIIEGLTPENHAAYSRDALYKILMECPEIRGVTFRIHGESGVAEGNYSFWRTVFEAIVRTGRKIEIDMHAKGIDGKMIDVALATGMPVRVSPKFWAEHMGLPYHQASIRELEMPPRTRTDAGFFALSSGSRKFLRYGYGDLLAEDRPYGVLHRIWPGTQRLLLWGDPEMAAAYGRAFSFCGSDGAEICEPLSFKGRKGSGIAGGRCAYADTSLKPQYDWQKYLYTYRLWGRMLYHPAAGPEIWRRYLQSRFQLGARAAEAALGNASRILPLITTAHGASAANNNYWPEMYTNMPIVDGAHKHPYSDTPAPRRFGAVSAFDPELFSRIDDCASELLDGRRSGKYSPLEVAQWLEGFAASAASNLGEAEKQVGAQQRSAEFLRWSVDVSIQSGLGRFFAWKLRSGVFYALHAKSGDPSALEQALAAYREARAAWAQLASRAEGVYMRDVTFGFDQHMRGHWIDRLAAIDEDIAAMQTQQRQPHTNLASGDLARAQAALRQALGAATRPPAQCLHTPPAGFRRGESLPIELSIDPGAAVTRPEIVRTRYRRVNQGETYQSVDMERRDNRFRALIPGEYTDSPFPLQYFFELRYGRDSATLYPGLDLKTWNQPYFVVRQSRA